MASYKSVMALFVGVSLIQFAMALMIVAVVFVEARAATKSCQSSDGGDCVRWFDVREV